MSDFWGTAISLSSFIIAIVTAIVLIIQMDRKKPNIKIWTKTSSHFLLTTDYKDETYPEMPRFYKWMRIENVSENPISICSFCIYEKREKSRSFVSNSSLNIDNDEKRPVNNIVVPIIKIEPYGTIEGYVLFVGLFQVPDETKKYVLEIETPRKIFKKDISIDYTEKDI